MCGICGIAQAEERPVDREAVEAMNATLRHRGPDSSGLMVEGPVGMAMRRLSIIDLAGGDQPIRNESGTLAVFQNGEIYNYRQLRDELVARGHRLHTQSDTEVLVHLYEEAGPAFVERLRGMFAIALWDAPRRRLVLARDRFGIKPLYYRHVGDSLSYASELKALLQVPGFSREIDHDALEAYLQLNWIPTPLTIFREARKLPAGHVLIWEGGGVTLERYSRPRPVPREARRQEGLDSLASELRDRLRDSVRAHLVADVDVGVLLSGGVDSSMLAALASEESDGRVKSFSIGFEEESFNELDLARTVARRYGTDHHELIVRPNAVELLPTIVETFDEPFADSSALPTYLVAELASSEVKVALAGEGGDELFGGYLFHVADRLAPLLGPAAWAARPLLERLPSSSGAIPIDDKLKRFARAGRLPPMERHCAWLEVFSADARRRVLRPERRGQHDPLDIQRARWAETENAELFARFLDVDLGVNLVDDQLVKTDRTSMAHSLEVRVPMLDPVVVELALSLRAGHRVRGFQKKRVLRRAAEPLVPREILDAPKRGFSIPVAAWLRDELQPFVREALSAETLERQGIFDPVEVSRLIDQHVSRRENLNRQLWSLLVFTLWMDRFGSGSPGVSRPGTGASAL
jgi:asparagine synthase (glutamine-hydrolysing)